jgi:protocatechuate 3,4-dioxygenase beta subunit
MAGGEPLVVEAVVLDSACRPATGAQLTVWHTDAQGWYGPGGRGCCFYRGTVRTDSAGRFRLQTIRPAQYPVPDAPPAHIHLEITHRAGTLTTEVVFDAGPPPTFATPTGRRLPIVVRREGATWRAEAVFVLAGAVSR